MSTRKFDDPTFYDAYLPIYAAEPVPAARKSLLAGSISALIGGRSPILQRGEDWPRCRTCDAPLIPHTQISASSTHTPAGFRALLPDAPDSGAAVALFQVFVCVTDTGLGTCLELSAMRSEQEGCWLARIIRIPVSDFEAADADDARHAETLATLDKGEALLPERIVSGWREGTPEIPHEATDYALDLDPVLYDTHAPVEGLKLLGYPVCGKYYGATESHKCTEWRCLVQLGTYTTDDELEDEDLPVLQAIGNVWIQQCQTHKDYFDVAMSGDW